MALITGTVLCLQISEDLGFTTIEDTNGDREIFILYFTGSIPPVLNSFTRILHSMWVSLLRDAISNGLTVTIIHPDASAEVTTVRLGAF